jgi:hypothetical protein
MTRTVTAKARRRAQVAITGTATRPGCPTPTKHGYDDAGAIAVAIKRSRLTGKPLRIYDCECGYKHLTSRVQKAA